MTGVRDYSTGELKQNVVASENAEAADRRTTTARDRMWGPTFPELVEGPTWHSDHQPISDLPWRSMPPSRFGSFSLEPALAGCDVDARIVRIVENGHESAALKKILEHLGLSVTKPPKAPARGATQLELDERPADELRDEVPNYDW
jgi:hypothetical protein